MSDSKTKIKEILAVLNAMFILADENNPLSIQDYVKGIKQGYGLDVDRRRVSQILNDLYDIQKEEPDYFIYFKIRGCKKGKGKIYAEKFFDVDDGVKLIKAVKSSSELTKGESFELINYIYLLFTENQREEIKKRLWKKHYGKKANVKKSKN